MYKEGKLECILMKCKAKNKEITPDANTSLHPQRTKIFKDTLKR